MSLYLDFYHDGKRRYEYLKLYLIPERTKLDKERNRATLVQAEAMKAKRIIEYQQGIYGVVHDSSFNNVRIADYVEQLVEKRQYTNQKLYSQYLVMARRIRDYHNAQIRAINKTWILGFMEHLRGVYNFKNGGTLSNNTLHLYMSKLIATLNLAVRDGIISSNPCNRISADEKPKRRKTEICYLTIDEVRTISETPCIKEIIRQAFLFSCFTGLRYSDVASLRWSDIVDGQIRKSMVKTKDIVIVPLSDNAARWMPARTGTADGLVFEDMPSLNYCNVVLNSMCKAAGLAKKVTFHVARHTAATLWLTFGADLYVVSKLLGHRSIASTQIYAKVVDESRKKAVKLIPTL